MSKSIPVTDGTNVIYTIELTNDFKDLCKESPFPEGDLVFYKNGKKVGHVAIYIGDGQVIHSSNEKDGVKISKMNYRTPYCIRRVLWCSVKIFCVFYYMLYDFIILQPYAFLGIGL